MWIQRKKIENYFGDYKKKQKSFKNREDYRFTSFSERVREKSPNQLYEQIFRGQSPEDFASTFACIGAKMSTTHSESVWPRTVEPDCVSSDIGARLQSHLSNWGGYIVSSGKIGVEVSSFSNKTPTFAVKFIPLLSSWFWMKIKNTESRNRGQRLSKCRVADIQRARSPEMQKSRNPVVMSCQARHFIVHQCVTVRQLQQCEWARVRAEARARARKLFHNNEKL